MAAVALSFLGHHAAAQDTIAVLDIDQENSDTDMLNDRGSLYMFNNQYYNQGYLGFYGVKATYPSGGSIPNISLSYKGLWNEDYMLEAEVLPLDFNTPELGLGLDIPATILGDIQVMGSAFFFHSTKRGRVNLSQRAFSGMNVNIKTPSIVQTNYGLRAGFQLDNNYMRLPSSDPRASEISSVTYLRGERNINFVLGAQYTSTHAAAGKFENESFTMGVYTRSRIYGHVRVSMASSLVVEDRDALADDYDLSLNGDTEGYRRFGIEIGYEGLSSFKYKYKNGRFTPQGFFYAYNISIGSRPGYLPSNDEFQAAQLRYNQFALMAGLTIGYIN